MSNNPSALQSLTANYTDSENEDGHNSDDDSPPTEDSNESQVINYSHKVSNSPNRMSSIKINRFRFPCTQVIFPTSKQTTPIKVRSAQSTPSKVEAKSGLRLVSYHDDTVVSGDESSSSDHEMDVQDVSDDEANDEPERNDENKNPDGELKRDRFAEYGFSLPPEAKGKCPPELQDKIANMYDKMRTNNMDMNKLIQERKEFRNPSIYEKLIQFCDIDELGTKLSARALRSDAMER